MDQFVCQKSIAKELKLSQSTVSLALRNRPGVSELTAKRVRSAAERLGYVPDPMLVSLANYRNKIRPSPFQSVIPWLHADKDLAAHSGNSPWGEILEGAKFRAHALGFKLEPYWIGQTEHAPKSFARMLHSRGIAGAICGPSIMNTKWLKEFTQTDFPIVCVGVYPSGELTVIHVSADHYQNARVITRIIEGYKFKKVLVLLENHLEKFLLKQYLSLFQRLAADKNRRSSWAVNLLDSSSVEKIGENILSSCPEIIVLQGVEQYRTLKKSLSPNSLSYLMNTPIAMLCYTKNNLHPAGQISIDECLSEIGAASITQLASYIATWKSEPSKVVQRVLIQGKVLNELGKS